MTSYDSLIAAPGDLAAGITLPANARLYASVSVLLASTTAVVSVNGVDISLPAGAANAMSLIGWFERDRVVTKVAPSGTVSLYAEDGLGVLRKIAEG